MVSCAPAAGRDTPVRWSDVRERYFIGFLKRNPVTATYLGGDACSPELADVGATLPDVSRRGRAEEIDFCRPGLSDLERVHPPPMPSRHVLDAQVVRSANTLT